MTATFPRQEIFIHDGLEIAWLDWGGDGECLFLLHPNGFCAGVYAPLAEQLQSRFRVVAVDLRGHGASETVIDEKKLGNDDMAADVLAVADHLGIEDFNLLGVSLGGGVSIEIAASAPERVKTLILIEAIAMPGDSFNRPSAEVGNLEPRGPHPLAVGARKRRVVWPDRQTVVESYGSRPPLKSLALEALEAYVQWGFEDRADGQIELACNPETEAVIFDSNRYGPIDSFNKLSLVKAPSSVLYGSESDLDPIWFEKQAAILGVEAERIDGSHFFLFEDIPRATEIICSHLEKENNE
tara:strand:- start:566 stop:1456 length:891 start_codon:yes stop_codon:yes gene_type:complete